jgi:hypothetical protein
MKGKGRDKGKEEGGKGQLTLAMSWISRHEHLGEKAWVPQVKT